MSPSNGVRFRPISKELTHALLAFASNKNLGQTIEIGGETYTLDYLSVGRSSYWRSRSASVYYRVGRSVVRISDHWSAMREHPRSQKLNCGCIGGGYDEETNTYKPSAYWELHGAQEVEHWALYAGRYPWRMFGGRAGLSVLNRGTTHWA